MTRAYIVIRPSLGNQNYMCWKRIQHAVFGERGGIKPRLRMTSTKLNANTPALFAKIFREKLRRGGDEAHSAGASHVSTGKSTGYLQPRGILGFIVKASCGSGISLLLGLVHL